MIATSTRLLAAALFALIALLTALALAIPHGSQSAASLSSRGALAGGFHWTPPLR